MKITLTKHQWERISEITGGGGLLVFGSVVIPFLIDKIDLPKAIWGIVISICLWYISVILARRY